MILLNLIELIEFFGGQALMDNSFFNFENKGKNRIEALKIFSLEMIILILKFFKSKKLEKTFIKKTKSILSEILLCFCISESKSYYLLSFKIFRLLIPYREELKSELGSIIELVFMKLITSENTSFAHRNDAIIVNIFYNFEK